MRRIKHEFSIRKFQQTTSPENQLSDPKCRKRHRFSGEQVGRYGTSSSRITAAAAAVQIHEWISLF